MRRQTFPEILSLLRHPSHYLGSEINAIRKDPSQVRLRFALAFPDLYEVGMSHIGMQILYYILNRKNEIAAERVFAPGTDLERELRAANRPLCSLETRTPLAEFDIIGFSLMYELTYTNILNMLSLSSIPYYSKDRDMRHPFIIAGGPCAFNPEPLADFFDAIIVGDGEEVILQVADAWLEWKDAGADRESLLKEWSKLQGVYIPSFFEPAIDPRGFQLLEPTIPGYTTVRKALVCDLDGSPYPDRPVVPFGRPVHDRLSLEVFRGCTRGCRFCQAGMIYRPVRERSPETVLSLAERALANTGYEEVSLLSLSTGDYTSLLPLMEQMMKRCEPEQIAVSLPSLRVDSLTEKLLTHIKRVRKTGFTIAPEAGSQRLRDVINKNITEETLEKTVRTVFESGWQLIKLYFMIGLPTETKDDIDAIVHLVKRLQGIPVSRKKRINVSVSTFVPKAHTPFQWCSQISVSESRERLRALRSELKGRGLRFKWQDPEMSFLEGLWARGDRRLSPLLVRAYEMGCRLDAWSEHFRFDRWQEAIEASGIDTSFYATRPRDLSEPLPWHHIDSGVSEGFLKEEWQKALTGSHTQDCRTGRCALCGVCDFKRVKPISFAAKSAMELRHLSHRPSAKPLFKKLVVSYSKRESARYFGHLELIKIFTRAIRRARIPLRFSEGFHPAPKISFESALPVGIESEQERFLVEVPLDVQPAMFIERLNQQLPNGLTVTTCKAIFKEKSLHRAEKVHYTITLKDGAFSETKLNQFLKAASWPLTKRNPKAHIKTIDLKKAVTKLQLLSPTTAELTLDLSSGQYVRPTDALIKIFGLSERSLRPARIIKRLGNNSGF